MIIGLSGGIDSALTACIAAEAVGPENVIGVGMPGPYSSQGSIDDARTLAANLGIRFELLCITDIFESYRKTLQKVFAGRKEDMTEENIQARTRGALLMALSNKFGAHRAQHREQERTGRRILHALWRHGRRPGSDFRCAQDPGLSPEPLREFAPGRDSRRRRWRSRRRPNCVPTRRTSTRCLPTTCWMRFSKTTLRTCTPRNRSPPITTSISRWCRRVIRMVDGAEYKRQQAAPGLKISLKAFGSGRRFPIAAKIELMTMAVDCAIFNVRRFRKELMRRSLLCCSLVLIMVSLAVAQQKPAPKSKDAPAPIPGFSTRLPSEETVNAFMRQMFGYDPTVSWKIVAIRPSSRTGTHGCDGPSQQCAGTANQPPLRHRRWPACRDRRNHSFRAASFRSRERGCSARASTALHAGRPTLP